jgi:hypothetical protein
MSWIVAWAAGWACGCGGTTGVVSSGAFCAAGVSSWSFCGGAAGGVCEGLACGFCSVLGVGCEGGGAPGSGLSRRNCWAPSVFGSFPFSEGLAGVCWVEDGALGDAGGVCSAGGFCAPSPSAMPESKLNSKATNPNPNRVLFRLHVAELLLKKRSSPSFWIELRESDAGNSPEVGPKTRNRRSNPCIPLRTKLRQAQTTWNFCFLLC